MTELEKIAYAKGFIDKLANGINPIDDTQISENEVVNNIRISRCLFFVSDILRQVLEMRENALPKAKKTKSPDFFISTDQIQSYQYTKEPITATAIARKISFLKQDENMKNLSYRQIEDFLLSLNLLCYNEDGARPHKIPTAEGQKMGISVETRRTIYGREYMATCYNAAAQEFIIDNIEAVLATSAKKKKAPNDSVEALSDEIVKF